ncbi:MAG: ATP-binding cassette domain-containing protein [Candidatus Obscuribacter sp.]|nr:ATP-binding cassette domain-containing protein [Candidatus Obscuribacter sp.]
MNPTTVSTASLRTENLTKRFGKRSSVDNLNLSIYPGELYALLGDNGAGKTTTIGMLTTLLAPTSGTFYICGYNGLTQARQIRGSLVWSRKICLSTTS